MFTDESIRSELSTIPVSDEELTFMEGIFFISLSYMPSDGKAFAKSPIVFIEQFLFQSQKVSRAPRDKLELTPRCSCKFAI